MRIEPTSTADHIVLITGDREWTDLETVVKVFETLPKNTVIVHGYCRGLDLIGDVVAEGLGFRRIKCPAHWRHSTREIREVWGSCDPDCREVVGKPAGAVRNHWMLDTYHPVVVHGFHNNITESRGTKGMLTYALKRGVEAWLHTSTEQWVTPNFKKGRSKPSKPAETVNDFFEF